MPYSPDVPPHLGSTSWLTFESSCAESFAKQLKLELGRLDKQASVKAVHDTRVALRRWGSVWSVFENDGWQSKEYDRKFGKPLKKLLKALGEIRDLDVNIKIGQEVAVPAEIIDQWKIERHKLKQKIEKKVKKLKLKSLAKNLAKYLKDRPNRIVAAHTGKKRILLKVSAYDHLNNYLSDQERLVQALDTQAKTPDELHQLRLSIKRWRYLLTEFFGLTNLQLYNAQQYLGKLHDYNRLILLVQDNDKCKASKQILTKRYNENLAQYRKIRKHLCYGLRPEVKSATKSS